MCSRLRTGPSLISRVDSRLCCVSFSHLSMVVFLNVLIFFSCLVFLFKAILLLRNAEGHMVEKCYAQRRCPRSDRACGTVCLCLSLSCFCLISVSNVSPMYNSNFTTAWPETCVCVRVWALTSPSFFVILSAHLVKLGKLMQERKKDQAQASVLEFFREFGTHVLPGPILWGGVVR